LNKIINHLNWVIENLKFSNTIIRNELFPHKPIHKHARKLAREDHV